MLAGASTPTNQPDVIDVMSGPLLGIYVITVVLLTVWPANALLLLLAVFGSAYAERLHAR